MKTQNSDSLVWILLACLLLPGFGSALSTFFGGILLAILFSAAILGALAGILAGLCWLLTRLEIPEVSPASWNFAKGYAIFSVVLFIGVHATSIIIFGHV